jgi:hypothetical protein
LMINVSNAMRFRHPGVDGQDEKDTQSSSTWCFSRLAQNSRHKLCVYANWHTFFKIGKPVVWSQGWKMDFVKGFPLGRIQWQHSCINKYRHLTRKPFSFFFFLQPIWSQKKKREKTPAHTHTHTKKKYQLSESAKTDSLFFLVTTKLIHSSNFHFSPPFAENCF